MFEGETCGFWLSGNNHLHECKRCWANSRWNILFLSKWELAKLKSFLWVASSLLVSFDNPLLVPLDLGKEAMGGVRGALTQKPGALSYNFTPFQAVWYLANLCFSGLRPHLKKWSPRYYSVLKILSICINLYYRLGDESCVYFYVLCKC